MAEPGEGSALDELNAWQDEAADALYLAHLYEEHPEYFSEKFKALMSRAGGCAWGGSRRHMSGVFCFCGRLRSCPIHDEIDMNEAKAGEPKGGRTHTPGPWSVAPQHNAYLTYVTGPDGSAVAGVYTHDQVTVSGEGKRVNVAYEPTPHGPADAALVAVAPDLLQVVSILALGGRLSADGKTSLVDRAKQVLARMKDGATPLGESPVSRKASGAKSARRA